MTTIPPFSTRFPLHGDWQRSMAGRVIDFVPVPGSFRPVGECVLASTFDHPWPGELGSDRLFLVTEGVMAQAKFEMNGSALGSAGPFATYRFAIPAEQLRAQGNVLSVCIRDIIESFGITPGRRFDAGLNRAIYLERRPAAFIESVAFRPTLSADLSAASCQVLVEINGETDAQVTATLTERASGRVIASAAAPAGAPLCFDIAWPRLWSPETPDLYTLRVELAGARVDIVEEMVGFRRIEVRGQDFFLNEQRLLIKGVCRHEFTSLHGYTPPEEEVRRELALIKHSGFNHVRLVHAPQAPCVPRIAAELGLLVTEEPGTCWHDLRLPEVAEQACEALCRTVLRDRNLPSIFSWHLYNECEPVIPYAVEAARRCREIDPVNLVATVNSTGDNALIHEITAAAKLAYYGINQYSLWHNDYVDRMSHFSDLPLIFTEWGASMLLDNAKFLQPVIDAFVAQSQSGATPRIAGWDWWAWADYEEHSRPPIASIDGWTIEGLLDQQARPRPELQMLSHACFAMDHPTPLYAPPVEVLARAPQRAEHWLPISLQNITGEQSALEVEVAKIRARFSFVNPAFGKLLLAGIPFTCREGQGQAPLLLGAGRAEIVIPIGRRVRGIAFLGQVALRGGYPYNTTYSVYHPDQEVEKPFGHPASRYSFLFADGQEEEALLHGQHILRGNNICRWWKTLPRAPETLPAVQTVLHPSYEILRYDLWEKTLPAPRFLKEIRWTLDDAESIQALLGLSVLVDEG